jgi:hypothetical protein
MYSTPHLFKTPQNTSVLTGHQWVHELLAGHPCRFHNMMGMSKAVFRELLGELQVHAGLGNTRHIAREEQLAVFLRMCRAGQSHCNMQERFQHSPNTISKYVWVVSWFRSTTDSIVNRIFHHLLGMLTSTTFYNRYIKLLSLTQVPYEIASNPKLFPFFSDCLGAIDGSHVDTFVPDNMLAHYQDRKGRISQNVLTVCTFDM